MKGKYDSEELDLKGEDNDGQSDMIRQLDLV